MLFSRRVRSDLHGEVLSKEFDVFFQETLRREPSLAAFESAAALLDHHHETGRRCARRDAAVRALLGLYERSRDDRRRVGALLLLVLWEDVAPIVRGTSRQLSMRRGFSESDADDIEQALLLDLLKRLPRFDPTRASLRTFVTRLVDHCVATLIEAREAACRDWRRRRETLHDVIRDPTGEQHPRWTVLGEEDCRNRILAQERDGSAVQELRLDLDAAVEALPQRLRDMAEQLKADSPTGVARESGVHRSTVYDARRRIRAHLVASGIADYVAPARRPAEGAGR